MNHYKNLTFAISSALAIPLVNLSPSLISTASAEQITDNNTTEPTVYGRVRLGFQRNETDQDNDNFGAENSSSRFGIKGSEAINDNFTALYQYEFGVSAAEDDNSTDALTRRLSWVGFKGDMGKISLGRQISTYYQLTGSNFDYGQGFNEENYLFFDVTPLSDKISDTAQYQYSFNEFTIGADIVLDQDDSLGGQSFSIENRNDTFQDVDAYTLAAQYKTDDFMISAGYINSDSFSLTDANSIDQNSAEVWSIYSYYNVTDNQQLYFGFDDGSSDTTLLGNNTIDGQAYHIGYSGRFNDIGVWGVYNRISLDQRYYDNGNISDIDADRNHFSFGTSYYISPRTRFFAEGTFIDTESSDTSRQYIGIRHDF